MRSIKIIADSGSNLNERLCREIDAVSVPLTLTLMNACRGIPRSIGCGVSVHATSVILSVSSNSRPRSCASICRTSSIARPTSSYSQASSAAFSAVAMPSSSISASSIEIHRFIILPPISLKRIFPINVILPYLRKFCQANRPFSNAIFILICKKPCFHVGNRAGSVY